MIRKHAQLCRFLLRLLINLAIFGLDFMRSSKSQLSFELVPYDAVSVAFTTLTFPTTGVTAATFVLPLKEVATGLVGTPVVLQYSRTDPNKVTGVDGGTEMLWAEVEVEIEEVELAETYRTL